MTTEQSIRKYYVWRNMERVVRTFVSQCMHYISTTRGVKELRPFSPDFHGTIASDLLQFDDL